jgi:hypothetical protein
VTAKVQAKARQGLEVAREGLDRLKDTTTHLVEEVKERIGRTEEPREPREPEPSYGTFDEETRYDSRYDTR